jgi:hypothetical protein
VKVSESSDAPASKVWELLGDFGGIMKWGGGMLQSCVVEGAGVGAVRRIGLPGGIALAERCEAYDDGARSLSYSIIEGAKIFSIKDYVSVCKVVDTGAGECRVDWSGTFEADGVNEERAQGTVRGIYTAAIAGVRKHLLGG